MTDYKPGDRVRVTFESAVTEDTENGFLVVVDPDREHHYVAPDQGWTIEKITPDYKAQIEALEPGTAFVLDYDSGKSKTFLRSHSPVTHVVNSVAQLVHINGLGYESVTDLRILK